MKITNIEKKETQIYCSTYQSLYKLEPEYFKKFKAFMLDECHLVKGQQGSQCVTTISENCVNACYRVAYTGTFHEEMIHKTVVEAHFGSLFETISTAELIERGQVTPFKVNSIMVKYPDDITKELSRLDWQTQKEFQESNENPRQELIIKLAESFDENTLILFNLIEHGKYLYSQLANNTKKKNVYFIDGSISGEERNQIVAQMEQDKGSILVASYGTTSAGINCKNLHNVIFASSYKSKIRVLQSIGRSLRLHQEKTLATLYDLVDSFGYMADHYDQRKAYYKKEKFPFKEIEVKIDDWVKGGCDVSSYK